MTELDDFLIMPVSTLDQLLAKTSHQGAGETALSATQTHNSFNSIDEFGLLPGAQEAKTISGYVPNAVHAEQTLEFAPLASQTALADLHLSANGMDLTYRLNANHQQLIATAGIDGPNVFHVDLKPDGTYFFTLHHPIDRVSPQNLADENAWQTAHEINSSKMSQLLATEPNMPYQFTLHYTPGIETIFDKLLIYWDHQLLQTIETSLHDPKGYSFSVESSFQDPQTLLEIVGLGGTGLLNDFIQNISVASSAQYQLPIDFSVLINPEQENATQSVFTVNVTNTPAIELNNQHHFDIFYEQSVYQTIIVNDENTNDNPLTTINLDSLFKQLSIEENNRLVEVVQRTEDGIATNVYEIKISDKMQEMAPITIADVQLSFPGGNGGMSVFERHVAINEGNTHDIVFPPIIDII